MMPCVLLNRLSIPSTQAIRINPHMAEPNPFVPTLFNHPFFNADLIPTNELDDLCDELWPLVVAHLPDSRKKPHGPEYVFRSLIANLCMVWNVGQTALIVPRNKRFLRGKSRYRPSQVTYDSV